MDLAKNKKGAPGRRCCHGIFLVRPGYLVWLGLLSHHSMAMERERKTRRNKSTQLVYKILCRQDQWERCQSLIRRYRNAGYIISGHRSHHLLKLLQTKT